MLAPVLALALAACGDDPKPDQAAPEVTITAPTAGERVSDPIVVSGTVKDGKLVSWDIQPASRKKDVTVCQPQSATCQ